MENMPLFMRFTASIPAFSGASRDILCAVLGTVPGIIGRMLGNSELELLEFPKEYFVRPYTPAGVDLRDHDVSTDVLFQVVHWLRKEPCLAARRAQYKNTVVPFDELKDMALHAQIGARYCFNEGCEVTSLLKETKVCPQCKYTRYCGDACQKHDWTVGGHREMCGMFVRDTR